jgi:hypothetical protein
MEVVNYLISISPSWIQYLFMERVMQIAKESSQASQVLQSKEKGGVCKGRRYQPLAPIRTIRLAVLRLSHAHRQVRS